jgi:uncharacterized protein DUF6946
MIPRLYVPLLEPEDVVRHLGKQEKHWKEGRSAHALACLWSLHNGFPPKIADVLEGHPDFHSAELVDAFLERKVDLNSEGRPSQTDLLAVIGIGDRLAIAAVEAKAGETFGEVVEDWLDGSEGKDARLMSLCAALGLSRNAALPLRYQLLHRTVSAVLEAKRYRATVAVLLIHSFSDDEKGFENFSAFLQAIRFGEPTRGALTGPAHFDGVSLYAGWVQDEAPKGDGPSAYLDDLRDYATRLTQECDRVRAWCDGRQKRD